MSEHKTCAWVLTDVDSSVWTSSCGTEFVLVDGSPEANEFYFCPRCGAEIRAVSEAKP